MSDEPVAGLVDAAGRLVSADPPLAALHLDAGGDSGGVLAPPRLAAVARLAARLRLAVSRRIVVAGEEGDLDLWVRATPEGDGVRLAIGGWLHRALPAPPGTDDAREADFLRAEADWTWTTDAALKLTDIVPAGRVRPGDALTRLFVPLPDATGGLPLLDAVATLRRFDDQPATLAGSGARVRLSAVPVVDGSGRFAGFRGKAVRLPDGADSSGDAFARRLDTALRIPLDRIVAHAETIRAQADEPLRRDYALYAADIATAGRHLLALVGDLVDLQGIERPDFTIAPEAIDLADVARRAAGLLGVRAADRGLRVERPEEDVATPALGDFRRVLQILVNLIGNAIRYAPEGSTVSVRVSAASSVARVVVADAGRGIAPADQARIFDRFERVDPAEAGGSGLGLYISRRLARAMGGDVTVESVPGQGARFTLTLPADGPAAG